MMDDMELVECIYCNAPVIEPDEVPATDDDDGWAAAAAGHDEICECVATRAHRVFDDAPEAALAEAARDATRNGDDDRRGAHHYISTAAAADILGVTPRMVNLMIEAGKLTRLEPLLRAEVEALAAARARIVAMRAEEAELTKVVVAVAEEETG